MRLALFGFLCGAALGAADGTQPVYVLPMSNGLDQFLANRLAASQAYQVVTDLKRAQVVFTDKLGENFEQRLAELAPPPPAAAKKDDKTSGEKKAEDVPVARRSTMGGGKGTVFLVELASRKVLWSTFAQPRDSSPRQLDRTAASIVKRLTKGPARQ